MLRWRRGKKQFLVVYNYGQGGVWAIIYAHSRLEIAKKYPQLKIYRFKPFWMNRVTYNKIKTTMALDINDAPSGWLTELVA